jgi:hypothetical protein
MWTTSLYAYVTFTNNVRNTFLTVIFYCINYSNMLTACMLFACASPSQLVNTTVDTSIKANR